MSDGRIIFIVSDSTGETAEHALRAAMAQFRTQADIQTRLFSQIRSEAAQRRVLEHAKERDALVVYTLADPAARATMRSISRELDLRSVDLLSGLIREMSHWLDVPPLELPGLGHETDEAYFRRIEAVEFTVANDDGQLPNNLVKADLVFVGVSRTSKTPLSHYVAQRGFKVANVPLVKGIPPPKQLDDVDPRRVFALVIDVGALTSIRRQRLQTLGVPAGTPYADPREIRAEAAWARQIFRDHPQWTITDVTDRAVEETAAAVVATYRERFEPAEA